MKVTDNRDARSNISEFRLSREDLPSLYQAASAVSHEGQKSYKRWILANLVLVVIAALLGAASSWVSLSSAKVLAVVIAVVLLGAMMTKFINRRFQGDKGWFDGRAVAESVKTNAWRYMMRVPPFNDDVLSDDTFVSRLAAIQTDYSGLSQNLATVPPEMHQISLPMRRLRQMRWEERHAVYIRTRLEEQIGWYRNKSIEARSESTLWAWASFGAEFAGIVMALSIFLIPTSTLVNLIGVVAALAAGFQAWTQVCQHDELSRSYAMACQELVSIRDLMGEAPTEESFVTAVEYSEEAISREHTMWVAKRRL